MISELKSLHRILKKDGLSTFLNVIKSHTVQAIWIPYCQFKLKKIGKLRPLSLLVDFAFDHFNGLIRPGQGRSEILRLLEILDREKPKNILEVGTAQGGTLFLFSRVAHDNARLVSVDLPIKGSFQHYFRWRMRMIESIAMPAQDLRILLGNSQNVETLKRVESLFFEREVDFLFIDGDHSYEGVKKDFKMYYPLVKKGGIICLHDIVTKRADCGVPQLWNEIKIDHDYFEIVENPDQNFGIGLLRKSED